MYCIFWKQEYFRNIGNTGHVSDAGCIYYSGTLFRRICPGRMSFYVVPVWPTSPKSGRQKSSSAGANNGRGDLGFWYVFLVWGSGRSAIEIIPELHSLTTIIRFDICIRYLNRLFGPYAFFHEVRFHCTYTESIQ